MARLVPWLLVGLGSCAGGLARFAVARWMGAPAGGRFPLATFAINVSGSFALGLLGGALSRGAAPQAEALRLALGVGFCGGFTTFSTFEMETHALFEQGAWRVGWAYTLLSVATGLAALRLGLVAARSWF